MTQPQPGKPSDQLVRLSQAAKIVERITGERPHAGTIYRWASSGIRGERLKIAYAGGFKRTSEDWIRDFFNRVSHAAGIPNPRRVSASKRRARALSQLKRDDI